MKALTKEPFPFNLPDIKDDTILVDLFNRACQMEKQWKDYETKADLAKKDFDTIADQLIQAIKETGGTKWELKPGHWAKVIDKFEFSFIKENKSEVLEWISDNGADDTITIPWQSLQGFINNRYRYDDEPDQQLIERLPNFIKASERTKLQLKYK